MEIPEHFYVSKKVMKSLDEHLPIVALESTVITHGLPYPENYQLALDLEQIIREGGCQPATIGILDGKILVGMDKKLLYRLATDDHLIKISARDIGSSVAFKKSGGTTVAATLFIANRVGIKVFATGGIGGVHQNTSGEHEFNYDISSDLFMLAQFPVMVVSAGAKAILDLPATNEVLETLGVPVVGFGTLEFPAFYSRTSGISLFTRVNTPNEAAFYASVHWNLGFKSGILITVPPPEESALPLEKVNAAIKIAISEAKLANITGQQVTPFLLKKVTELTGGDSLQANLSLLRNNAKVAADIARQFCSLNQPFVG
jgi:pseudouridine-5'-phosphate glycosidase